MFRNRQTLISVFAALLAAASISAAAQSSYSNDPPDRVARLSYVAGELSIAPAGSDNWSVADRNRPLVTGDRLWSGEDGRAALDLGNASLRIDRNSAFDFAALDDQSVRVVLSQGTLNLAVRRLRQNQGYEVDTPTLAFVPSEEGSYRIDIDPDGSGAMVTLFRGAGTVWGANNSRRELRSGYSYRFDSADLDRVSRRDLPYGNDFDRFCADLDADFNRSDSAQYVADNMIGYSDLDDYGRWQTSTDYGPVWYPTQVAVDWAPYRYGHWAWIAPWGWTWVDDAPWGFAPFHYGRWALINQHWGWIPGPRLRAAVYAPALVAFVGNVGISMGGPVSWFPLGPRDLYLPPYHVSQNYFVSINLSGGRFFNRQHVHGLYDDYRHDRWRHDRHDYAYRYTPRAVTRVPHEVFTHARPVQRANERMSEAALQSAALRLSPMAKPVAASYAAVPRGTPPRGAVDAFSRNVVSRAPARRGGVVARDPAVVERSPPRGAVARNPVLPSRGVTERAPIPVSRVDTVPRSGPAQRGGVMRAPDNRSVYTPANAPRQQPLPRAPRDMTVERAPVQAPVSRAPITAPRAQPVYRAPERATPRHAEPLRSAPTRSVYTPTRPYSAPVATPRQEQPAPRRFKPAPQQFEPVSVPRSQPMSAPRNPEPRRYAPAPRPEPRASAPQSMPAPVTRDNDKDSRATPRGRPVGGFMPRGNPGH